MDDANTVTGLAEGVAEHARKQIPAAIKRLAGYLAVQAISCDPEHAGDVHVLAKKVRDDLRDLTFEARILELDGALPLVTAAWLQAGPDKPTVLIYGHLDLQPVHGENWSTDPHEAVERDGRLFARGAADDMGGWVSHLVALEAWLKVAGEIPVNVRLVIEGEEEIGSPNLERYMDAFPEAFAADVMVLTDCENPATDIPGLTVSLRGLYDVELICEALESDVHSGIWGNAAPDSANALVLLLARLLDEDGRMCVGRVEVTDQWRRAVADIPLDDDVVRSGARLRESVAPLPDRERTTAEWIWRQPAITILSTTLPRPTDQKNAIRARASATLSVRLAPGQTQSEMRKLLEDALLVDTPGGVEVSLHDVPGAAASWLYEPSGPAFDAADRAYKKAWGRPLMRIGIGGSIPFVALFGRRFTDLPLILNGVMDPQTGAHGPDESMDLGVFEKAIVANVYLLAELADVGIGPAGRRDQS
jgi:acetylornithine deacetylase/succinyl-diaminopimelate desuccinylase-like protein